jgi:hypothetical protein
MGVANTIMALSLGVEVMHATVFGSGVSLQDAICCETCPLRYPPDGRGRGLRK